ncbi:hypothetical protein A3K86_10725 [Photobacterium jeanii]|uniref:DNA topoisomerase type IA zn finger domain-containing protein n=1 Tax=Photobacterium jeanii TaxID=858640 RepID=A0A178KGP5_9GAMM|nr:topoisomerase DNA-binding C4 zinc finger domain-containing protein [Photobacterium jeanii]OAN16489.1 hypothetical protein A3K86_10725 [Photobacterium jeanii]PST85995.1 hypothetical protein C9I91_22235 [Photobacterium jeanii]
MTKLINDVLNALECVDRDYYSIPDISFDNGKLIDNEKTRNLERRFMQAFSTEFSILNRSSSSYKDFKFDFEVPKKFMWYDNPDLNIRRTWEELNNRIGKEIDMHDYWEKIPDFLVHSCHDDKSSENQKIIIEAKVNPSSSRNEALKDIFHIFIYTNKYNFQCGVIMLIHTEKDKWVKWLLEYMTNNYYHGNRDNFRKIYVIFKKGYGEDTETFTLDEIIKEYHSIFGINDLDNKKCPLCGSKMVKRTAQRGRSAGSDFFGCTNYPRCSFTRNIT